MHPGRKVILLSCIDVKSFDGVGAVHNCVLCGLIWYTHRAQLIIIPCRQRQSCTSQGGMRLSNLAFVVDACEQTCRPYGLQPQPMFV
jgi:hypothetical protein